jgi:hypothetical protein
MDWNENSRCARYPGAEVEHAKDHLRACANAASPLNAIRRHPFVSLGMAFAAGMAAVSLPRTREAVLNATDRGIRSLLSITLPLVRIVASKATQILLRRRAATTSPAGVNGPPAN